MYLAKQRHNLHHSLFVVVLAEIPLTYYGFSIIEMVSSSVPLILLYTSTHVGLPFCRRTPIRYTKTPPRSPLQSEEGDRKDQATVGEGEKSLFIYLLNENMEQSLLWN